MNVNAKWDITVQAVIRNVEEDATQLNTTAIKTEAVVHIVCEVGLEVLAIGNVEKAVTPQLRTAISIMVNAITVQVDIGETTALVHVRKDVKRNAIRQLVTAIIVQKVFMVRTVINHVRNTVISKLRTALLLMVNAQHVKPVTTAQTAT